MVREVLNKKDIVRLWSEAFGDSEEDILFFTDNVKFAECLGCYQNDTLVSMLYFVQCTVDGEPSNYIYAACTSQEHRKKGYMKELLDYCKKNCTHSICLIPANESLIDYYKKNGISEVTAIDSISFNENEEIIEYLFEGCELKQPIALLYTKTR